ncbi:MAG: DUF3313 family protein [Betaproteobacteria bacterium]|jgi:hypothetical protein|nr:DUF3313 family protein [Rhodocyclaceae bacterium]MCA3135258.1 DUF3313 family protein [Rhodocyclaceae bacterium]MCA3141692.1 DUF3313 family protein [Rhodocyclaceae bacterium]MCA3145290.1 DUF3313 family protein [Rhodocyclaceae bacterium]MCE2896836.1 DUF3313 domain-containing protein [Betaproteobacteria bacterium]
MFALSHTPSRLRLRVLLSALVLAGSLTMAGCASVGSPSQTSLRDAEQLTAQPDGTRAWRAAEARVSAFYLPGDALEIRFPTKLDDEQQDALRKAFAQALVKELTDAGLRQADAAGPGVVQVRGVITDAELASPGLNVVTTLLVLLPLSRGGVSLDVEALGGTSRVAALSFKGKAGVNNVGSAFRGIGHAKLQTEVAARKFADLLLQRAPKSAS